MSPAKGKESVEPLELRGYVLPENKAGNDEAEDSDDDNEGEEQQPEFLDLAEIDQVSSGGHLFHSSVPFCKGQDCCCCCCCSL